MKKWKTDANGKKLYTVDVEEKTENKESDVIDSGAVQLQPVTVDVKDESSD